MADTISIAFVVPGLYAYLDPAAGLPPGGAERQAYLLATALAGRDDVTVHAVVPDMPGPLPPQSQSTIRLWPAHKLTEGPITGLRRLAHTLRAIDADIYIFRSAAIGVAVGMSLVRHLHKPILYMLAHDDETNFPALRRCVGLPCALAMSWAYRLPSAIAAQTEAQRDAFVRYRGRPVAGVIPNLCLLPPEPASPPANPRTQLLWIGRAQPWKRGQAFLELARRLPDRTCVMLCGPGKRRYADAWRRMAATLPNVTFHDALPHDTLQPLYRSAMLLVNTSQAEGTPNVMLEAMGHGCPILSAVVDPGGAIVGSGCGTCVGTPDPAALEAACRRLLADPVALTAMGRRGRDWVARAHAPALAVGRLMDMIRRVV